MNPYQIVGILLVCTLIFGGIVTGLTLLGIPLLLALLGVYFGTLWLMIGMQRRAEQSCSEAQQHLRVRRYNRQIIDDKAMACRHNMKVGASVH